MESAAVEHSIPLTDDHSRTDITVEGTLPKPGSFPHPDIHIVSRDYGKTLGIRLLRGRGFTDSDRENFPQVAMVNASVAQRLFSGTDPIGKRFILGNPKTDPLKWITIVGVVADTKMYGLGNPARLEVYFPFRQAPSNKMSLLVKSGQDVTALVSAIRGIVASIDKEQPIFRIATMRKWSTPRSPAAHHAHFARPVQRTGARPGGHQGIYGVLISCSATRREREIGIRMALGAQRADVLRLVLAQGGKISAAKIVMGSAASLGLTQLMAKLLYSVSAVDPATQIAVVAFVLALIAMVASYIPARRGLCGVDPMIALRQE